MKVIKKLILVLLVMVLILSTAGCAQSQGGDIVESEGSDENSSQESENNEKDNENPVIVRLRGGDYGLSHPFACYSRGPGFYKVKLVFDSLVEKDHSGQIPWLAKSWDVKDGGQKYVFQLREDVKWSDGESFTAEDVVFTYEYIKDFPAMGANDLALKNGIVDEVNALSDYEVEFSLTNPNPGFIDAVITINIIPKHIWEKVERPDEFTSPESLVGTGPYTLTDYSKENGTYRFEAREDFWGPAQGVDIIEYVPVSDEVLALEKGDIDLASIPSDSLSRFQDNPSFTIMENPGVWGYRLRFNMEKLPELKIKELRQAFAYAIDRQDIVDKIGRGAGVPGSMGILPPDHIWYNSELPKYERNIDKAKELLEQIDTDTIEYELLVGEGSEVRMGELIKQHLEEGGIKVNVVSTDTKSRDGRIADGNYDLIIVGHGGWARDVDYLRTRFQNTIDDWASGTPGYDNPKFTKLADMQLNEFDNSKRKEIVMDIQKILAEDIPEIPLYMKTGYTVYRNTTYDGWMYAYDHHQSTHNKLSFLNY